MSANEPTKSRCLSWEDLVGELEDLDGWIFRGHCSARWTLESTLERRNPSDRRKLQTEWQILRAFKRRAHNFLGAQEIPPTPGEWLALMQHFGAPTRLLDFTFSPFVAAYFAFEERPSDGCEECAIWAVNPTWCKTRGGRVALVKGALGYDAANITAGVKGSKSELNDDLLAGMIIAQIVGDHGTTSSTPLVTVFEPDHLTERMSAQQGVFLWPGNVDLTFMENLRTLGSFSDGVRKFSIPIAERGRALDQLRLMNITRASLFPGLDGFAQSLRQLPVRESAESRNTRASLRAFYKAIPLAESNDPDSET